MPSNNIYQPNDNSGFPVIGVGASSGGLDALRKLLQNIPVNSGMAYVLMQHLAPQHESLLPEILSRETKVPVQEITDLIHLKPDNIYIIPENKILTAIDGQLKLEPRESAKNPGRVIDIFLNSLAEVHQSFAVGVILSGSGFDGTNGLLAIKEFGGATFVQDPASAAFDSMPTSAINAGATDFVLEPEEIPLQLQHIVNAYQNNRAYTNDEQSTKTDDEFYKQAVKILRERTGNDFSHYKQPTIRRRIARRMVITKKESQDAYLAFLKNDKKEQDALFNDILIPVSYFFRDSKVFDVLCETVFPAILQRKNPDENFRVWIAGCSTGEEAYSMAICLHESLADKLPYTKVQLFASDISENVISKARSGIYTRHDVQNVSETRLKSYFTKTDGNYHINKEIRDMCVFAVHNFVKDPPFARMDVISCRNVLIYLDPFLQKKAMNTFHYALREHGVLFLGKSESVGHSSNLFEPMVKNQKIFARKDTQDNFMPVTFDRPEVPVAAVNIRQRRKGASDQDYQKEANDVLFTRYTPPGVIINENKEIVHFHGDTSPFLMQPPGKPNFNIYKMLRDGLAFDLRNALLKAKTGNAPAKKDNITVKDHDYQVSLEVVPLGDDVEVHYLILFHKIILPPDEQTRASQKKTAESLRIKQLEAEIEQMREDIRRVTEDQEAANEELQSANEELLSNSEELQTLNEELETSAEELQSNNEELITVNDELMDRQEQLTMARAYAETIIETIREPLVVLNRDMRVKSANAAFYNFFQTNEQDTEGRIIFEVGSSQWNIGDFKAQLTTVISEKKRLEGMQVKVMFEGSKERTMLLNISPMINDSLEEQLILLAIEDITEITAANITLRQNNRELEENNKELTSFSYIASHDLQEPLRKIHTFSKLVNDDLNNKLSADSKLYLDRIMVSSRRMQRLTEDLLRYSHITPTDSDDIQLTELSVVVHDVLEDFESELSNRNANVTVGSLPVVNAVPMLIRQLFQNLISNAAKYSFADKPLNLQIESEELTNEQLPFETSASQNYYRITINDNGIGFPPEHSKRIFEPFQRLHSKDKYEGTGIGLAICQKIVVYHKGFISAESIPGKGTAFHIYLPA